ncbi:MAG: hypothetical protein ACLP50_32185 [Solirubrobacteraceae bacterium]
MGVLRQLRPEAPPPPHELLEDFDEIEIVERWHAGDRLSDDQAIRLIAAGARVAWRAD